MEAVYLCFTRRGLDVNVSTAVQAERRLGAVNTGVLYSYRISRKILTCHRQLLDSNDTQ